MSLQKRVRSIFVELTIGSSIVWLAALLFTVFYYGAGATGHFFTGTWNMSPFLLAILTGTAIRMVFRHLYDYLVKPEAKKTKQMCINIMGTIGIYLFCFLILTVMSGTIAITFLQITGILSVLVFIGIAGIVTGKLLADKKKGQDEKHRQQKILSALAVRYERECKSRSKIGQAKEEETSYADRMLKKYGRTKWIWSVYLVFLLTEFFFLLIYTVIGGKISVIEVTGLILLLALTQLMVWLITKGSANSDVLREVKQGKLSLTQKKVYK